MLEPRKLFFGRSKTQTHENSNEKVVESRTGFASMGSHGYKLDQNQNEGRGSFGLYYSLFSSVEGKATPFYIVSILTFDSGMGCF